ncbi:MAG: fibrobacter succinogenes major paralogous domain-containing protein [Prevotellaceae bacterium]|jgi:uncharacterized protein (TIGR02145 family)|nr:fibrobacter succinogenes major paralogous domain-containing protein [Prevotellaceae bacterium]
MKKIVSLAMSMLLLIPLFGQGGRKVETRSISVDYAAAPPTVTFEVYWTEAPTPPRHRDTVWVFVDYALITGNVVGAWVPASITVATVSAGDGVVLQPTLNGRGFYFDGHDYHNACAATLTVTLSSDLTGKKFNWCAYATDYPPNATTGTGHYDLHGSPPFVVNGSPLGAGVRTYTGCITTLTDATGCPGWLPAEPVINAFTASASTACSGESITLSVDATGAASYSFNNSAWTVSADTTFVPSVGIHNYTIRVINAAGCEVGTGISPTVTVYDLPVITSATASPAAICTGKSTTLSITASNTTEYSFDGGSSWTASSETVVSPITNTTYTVYVKSANACTATTTIQVTVYDLPVITSATASPAAICTGKSTTLSITASNTTEYSFDGGSSWTASSETVVAPTANTTYTVYVKSANACTATTTIQVTVNPLPESVTLAASPSTICQGEASTLTISATGAASYSFNGTTWRTATDTIVSPLTTTAYTAYAKTVNGCTATIAAATTVTVNPLPEIASFTAALSTICVGQSTTLTVSATGTSLLYSLNDQSSWDASNAFTVSPTSTTTYPVYVKNADGCTATANVIVTVNPLPVPEWAVVPPAIACAGSSVTLTASGGGSYCFTTACEACIRNPYYSGNDSLGAADCNVLNSECTYTADNTYTLEMPESGSVTVWLRVKNDEGCIDSISTVIRAIDCTVSPTGCAPGTFTLNGVGFKSSSTYLVNGVTISAAVTVTTCDKTSYSGFADDGRFNADCRNCNSPSDVHLFSWCMVQQYADQLCPSPWRVPTKEDFCKIATGSSSNCNTAASGSTDGWEYGAYALANGTLDYGSGSQFGYYWSVSEFNLWNGYSAIYSEAHDNFRPENTAQKELGLMLRCVKD